SAFSSYGLTALAGAGGGRPPHAEGPSDFRAGETIGVELVRGDMSMVGTGTVTYVEGKNVAGFGHPMFGAGQIYLPVVTAQVPAFSNRIGVSFKVGSPVKEAGTLVQDRESCIVADTSGKSTMIPVDVKITSGGHEERSFHAEIARFRFL